MEHKEEKSCHPNGEMLIVLLAGSCDIVLDNALNKEFLQYCTERIEPAHISSEIESEPGSCRNLRIYLILNKTDNKQNAYKRNAHDSADKKVILKFLFLWLKAFKMDLESSEGSPVAEEGRVRKHVLR